jgi:hypothetical protein
LLDLGSLWAGRAYAQSGDYYQQALAPRTLMIKQTGPALNRLGNWYRIASNRITLRHQEALFTALSDQRATLRR